MVLETVLQDAVAQWLAARGFGSYSPDGAYAEDGTTQIFLMHYPDSPDDLITISTYPVEAAVGPDDSVIGLQIRTRCGGLDPWPVINLDNRIYATLHGVSNLALGGYRVTKIMFQTGGSMGQDGSGRWGRSANYYVTLPR